MSKFNRFQLPTAADEMTDEDKEALETERADHEEWLAECERCAGPVEY